METPAVVTRQKRKRVHSAKCACCSREPGKPELQARPSRKRKVDEVKREETLLLKTKRPTKSAQSKKKAEQEVFGAGVKDNNGNNEGRILRSGRSTPVCVETNAGNVKSVSQKASVPEKKAKKVIKEDLVDNKLIKQEDATENIDVISDVSNIQSDIELSTLFGITPTNKGNTDTKTEKQPSKFRSKISVSFSKSGSGRKSVQKKRKTGKTKIASKSNKQKGGLNVSKPKVTKHQHSKAGKTKGFNITTEAERPKKTSAIEKLKLRAFDSLKEKLEIAFDRSSISVPECSKLLQQITSITLREIFCGPPASVGMSCSELSGKNLTEIMTEQMQENENKLKESTVPENLSKAAQALVSFKTQVTSTSSRINVDQSSKVSSDSSTKIMQAVANDDQEIQNANNLTRLPGQWLEKPNISNLFTGATPALKQASTQGRFEETHNISTAHSVAGVQSISHQKSQKINHENDSRSLGNDSLVLTSSSWTFTKQLLQTANPVLQPTNQIVQTTIPLLPTTQVHLAVNSQAPTATQVPTLMNPLIPTSDQLLQTSSPLQTTNQLLSTFSNPSATAKTETTVVAISPGLPVVQTQSIFSNQPQMALQLVQTQGTNCTLPTITKTKPQFVCPSLPKITTPNQQPTVLTAPVNQPLFLPKITPPIERKTLGSTLPAILPDVKQPKDVLLPQMVSTIAQPRMEALLTTDMNELPNFSKLRPILPRQPLVSPTFTLFSSPQPTVQNTGNSADISNNVKQAVKRLVNGRTKSTDNNSAKQTTLPDIASTFTSNSSTNGGGMMVAQNNTEMASKEQAIKALLSIGKEQQTTRQGSEGTTNVTGSSVAEHQKPDDSLVVFDTNKAIFKVDDVIIDPQVNTIGKESYTCGKCGKIFTSLSYLARHIKRVCPDMTHRKWKCDHCDKAFRHPFGLQQHVFTHTGERPHKCTQCPKAFYSSNDLRRHNRIHSGERPYSCNHCGKTFATTISLKTHTFIHTGEKPHRCPHCPKTFATSSKLGRHIVTHSEQRPFACTHCPKTFNRSGDLRRHNINLHDGKCSVGESDEKQDSNQNTNEKLISNINGQVPN